LNLLPIAAQFEGNRDFVEKIVSNTRRYISLFSQAIDEILPAPNVDGVNLMVRVTEWPAC
jgi:hypothetical protein